MLNKNFFLMILIFASIPSVFCLNPLYDLLRFTKSLVEPEIDFDENPTQHDIFMKQKMEVAKFLWNVEHYFEYRPYYGNADTYFLISPRGESGEGLKLTLLDIANELLVRRKFDVNFWRTGILPTLDESEDDKKTRLHFEEYIEPSVKAMEQHIDAFIKNKTSNMGDGYYPTHYYVKFIARFLHGMFNSKVDKEFWKVACIINGYDILFVVGTMQFTMLELAQLILAERAECFTCSLCVYAKIAVEENKIMTPNSCFFDLHQEQLEHAQKIVQLMRASQVGTTAVVKQVRLFEIDH